MNKTAFIAAIAEKSEMTEEQVATVVSALGDVIIESLAKGDKITLLGFGSFAVKERAARTGHDPRNGKPIEIPATKYPVFCPGKKLKEAAEQAKISE